MSLRTRLFFVFGGLVAVLVAAQWWWVRGLSRELFEEVEELAVTIAGSTTAAVVAKARLECEEGHVGNLEETMPLEPSGLVTEPESKPSVRVFLLEGDEEIELHSPPESREQRAIQWIVGLVQEGSQSPAVALREAGRQHQIPIPRGGLVEALEDFSRRLLLAAGALLGVGLLFAGLVAHRFAAPLRELSSVAGRIGAGALGTQVESRSGGEVDGAIQAFNHMSMRLAELDARNRQLSARQHLTEIGEMARGLAHSLRNPLNAVGLSVEELGDRAGEAGADLVRNTRRQIRRVDQSVRSFLALASSGGVIDDVDVEAMARDVALEVLQDDPGRLRVGVEAEASLPRIRAVEPELRAVVQALVVNAAEASPDGAEVKVRITSEGADGLRIDIEDSGAGLPEEVRQRLFTPHLSTKASGSGMGLFLAHRIAVNRYAGELDLDDRPAGGTRARLRLYPRVDLVEVAHD